MSIIVLSDKKILKGVILMEMHLKFAYLKSEIYASELVLDKR